MYHVVFLGAGSFAHSHGTILRQEGAEITTYLTRKSGRYGASLVGRVLDPEQVGPLSRVFPDRDRFWIFPMSIDWMLGPEARWMASGPMFAPSRRGMRLERDRDFARRLCEASGVPVARAVVARNRLEAETILERHPIPWVIKNPLCSPSSPIHTIVCTTVEETRAWLPHLDFAEGVFLQEYLGTAELGHIALVSAGEIYSLVTNQEYKRSQTGEMGPLAGTPLGGMIEVDPEDRYGLARALLHPLLPWFRKIRYHGPVQVTAARVRGRWYVLEYNVRLGVTSGPLILQALENPLETLWNCAMNRPLQPRFRKGIRWGCSVSLVAYGFPYPHVQGPRFPVQLQGQPEAEIWWNEVQPDGDRLWMVGQRVADVCAVGERLEEVVGRVYRTLSLLRAPESYYRTDIGQVRWPPETVIEAGDRAEFRGA